MADNTVSQQTSNVFPAVQMSYTNGQPILNEWTNHSAFYAIYPSYYFTFANQWLRKWLAWFDGYVPGIHDGTSGILSTRLATTLCTKLAEQVFGSGLLFANSQDAEDSKKALEFISGEFSENADLQNQILKTFILAAAGGTSYIKVNIDAEKQLWLDTWRMDQCWSDIDFRGKVLRAKFLVAKFTKTVPNNTSEPSNFYIVEERFYATSKDNREYRERNKRLIDKMDCSPQLEIGKPYVKYSVYRLQGYVNDFNQGVSLGRSLDFNELPDEVKKSIRDDYGALKLNIPQKLPFTELGVFAFKWTSFISNLPQLPYGESVVAKIQAYLFEYDFMNSCMNTDFYLGRGRVLVPKALQNPKIQNLNGQVVSGNYNQGLDSFLFTKVEYASTEDKGPEPIQFDLRANDWLTARNHLLEVISTTIGISPSTIASFLQDSSARTAREISSEESSTALFVENHRKIFIKPLNDMIKLILNFYGYKDSVTAKFSKSGQTNTTLVIENTVSAYNAKLKSQYLAVKDINPDFNEDEIQAEILRLNEADNKRQQEQRDLQFGMDLSGNTKFGGS